MTVAESDATIVVDGYRYFPAASVQDDHLVASSHHSVCGWKGQASYYDVTAGTEPNRNAAWYYPDPKPAARMVDGYIGFWKGIGIEEAPTPAPPAHGPRRAVRPDRPLRHSSGPVGRPSSR